jgi:hypothetical protein
MLMDHQVGRSRVSRSSEPSTHPHFVRVSALRATSGIDHLGRFPFGNQPAVNLVVDVCGNGEVIHFALYGEAHPENVRVTASGYIGPEEPLSWSGPAVR